MLVYFEVRGQNRKGLFVDYCDDFFLGGGLSFWWHIPCCTQQGPTIIKWSDKIKIAVLAYKKS